jgi:predicted nucleic acid-binding protein
VAVSGNPALVDTNVVIYAHDPADPVKHANAQALLHSLSDSGLLLFSTQVLNEFCFAMMRPKRIRPISANEAREIVGDLSATGRVLSLSAGTTALALSAVERYGMSFWDALIWACAKENAVSLIYSEDIPSMSEIESVQYVNPFITSP